MDDSPQRIGARGTTTAWEIPDDDPVGEPFVGSCVAIHWAQQDLIHGGHYLLRLDGGTTIGRYSQTTRGMSVAKASTPHMPPFDIVGRIVRLDRPL
jgi:hypothetical protein